MQHVRMILIVVMLAGMAPTRATAEPIPQTAQDENVATQAELAYWNAIKDGNDRSLFEAYVKRFPKGVFVEIAEARIAALRATKTNEEADSKLIEKTGPTPEGVAFLARFPEHRYRIAEHGIVNDRDHGKSRKGCSGSLTVNQNGIKYESNDGVETFTFLAIDILAAVDVYPNDSGQLILAIKDGDGAILHVYTPAAGASAKNVAKEIESLAFASMSHNMRIKPFSITGSHSHSAWKTCDGTLTFTPEGVSFESPAHTFTYTTGQQGIHLSFYQKRYTDYMSIAVAKPGTKKSEWFEVEFQKGAYVPLVLFELHRLWGQESSLSEADESMAHHYNYVW